MYKGRPMLDKSGNDDTDAGKMLPFRIYLIAGSSSLFSSLFLLLGLWLFTLGDRTTLIAFRYLLLPHAVVLIANYGLFTAKRWGYAAAELAYGATTILFIYMGLYLSWLLWLPAVCYFVCVLALYPAREFYTHASDEDDWSYTTEQHVKDDF